MYMCLGRGVGDLLVDSGVISSCRFGVVAGLLFVDSAALTVGLVLVGCTIAANTPAEMSMNTHERHDINKCTVFVACSLAAAGATLALCARGSK